MNIRSITLITATALSGFIAAAQAQVKSAESILKDIRVEGRVSFPEESLPFKINSTELSGSEAKTQVVEIAKALKSDAMAKLSFQITGFTCDLGSESHNLDLSQRRAAAIKARLVTLGVPAGRLSPNGKGEAFPAVPNSSEQNRRQNRRVVITPTKS